MNTRDPTLTVRFDGPAVRSGAIPVSHLIYFLTSMNKALRRTAHLVRGGAVSLQRGQPPVGIREEVDLDLVLLTHGSPATVLGFDRRPGTSQLPGMDIGTQVLEVAINGLDAVQRSAPSSALPTSWDAGVLMAWRDAGALFKRDIASMAFTLRGSRGVRATTYTPTGLARIRERIRELRTDVRAIEGRLLMADFKEHGTRCRVHPSLGDPVLCEFEEEQKDEVLENLLHYVRVIGRPAKITRGKVVRVRVHDMERLERQEDESRDLPRGGFTPLDFWTSPTLDELAKMQNVGPLDAGALAGTWPGEVDDGFDDAIDELRHAGRKRDVE